LLEKFPRRKRIGRNSQNCTEKWEPTLVIVTGAEIPQEVAPLIVEFAEIKSTKNFWTWWNIETWFTLHLWPRINPKKYATLVRNYFFIYFSPMMDDGWGQLLHSGWQF
jgi:hypothetical protein